MRVLRSAVFNAYFFGITFLLGLIGVPLRWLAPARTLDFAQAWAGLVLAGLRRICGIDYVLEGREHLPPGAALLASQHQSAFDTLVWMTLLPRPAYVLKQELTRIPLFGPLTVSAGMIALDRGGGARALRNLVRATRAAVADGRQIVIFPEGTRLPPGQHRPLQPGIAAMAAAAELPVLPVVTDSGRHWGRRAFRKHPGTIRIRLLPPIPAGLRREALMAELTAALHHAGPVDKSVGTAPSRLPADRKQKS